MSTHEIAMGVKVPAKDEAVQLARKWCEASIRAIKDCGMQADDELYTEIAFALSIGMNQVCIQLSFRDKRKANEDAGEKLIGVLIYEEFDAAQPDKKRPLYLKSKQAYLDEVVSTLQVYEAVFDETQFRAMFELGLLADS